MLRDGVEDWMVALFIFAAVAVGMIGAGWSQWLEHRRRSQAMDVIKAALEAGKEPPAVLYDQIAKTGQSKPPWTEVIVFGALGFGFWIAYAQAQPDDKLAYLVVASTMSLTSLICLAIALMRPGRGGDKDDDAE